MTLNDIKYITSTQDERETLITIRDDEISVYTTDSKWLTKLKKLYSDCPEIINLFTETHNKAGETTSIDCELNMNLVNISIKRKMQLSEEEKTRRAERMRQLTA